MIELRPYQREAANAAWVALCDLQNPLVVMATGTGKSPVFAEVARRWTACTNSDVLVMAHRRELLDQARRHLSTAGVPGDRVIVRSVQSFYSPKAKVPKNIGLVIYDEAHHAPAPCNQAVLARFPGALVLGLTATPDRSDGVGLGRVFHRVAFRFDAERATREGYLTAVRRVSASTVDELRALAGERQTIVFCESVDASKKLARAIGPLAAHLDGETPRQERARVVAAFAAGKVRYLCNCDLVTEGFDVPACEVAAIMRNVKSRGLLAQMVGRAMRLAPGKQDCLLVQLPDAVELGLLPPPEVLADGRVKVRDGRRAPRSAPGRTLGDRVRSAGSAIASFLRWMWR